MSSALVIIGGGGHSLVVGEAARLASLQLTGFFDDNPDAVLATTGGARHLGPLATGGAPPGPWILGLGDLAKRRDVIYSLGSEGAVSVAHPWAMVSPTARIGLGVFIGPGAIIHSYARVEDHAIINSGAIVEHECVVGENSHIAPGTALGGRVMIGRDTLIGLGTRVLPGLAVGAHCIIGAGAVVTQAVPDDSRVVGVPGRVEPRG